MHKTGLKSAVLLLFFSSLLFGQEDQSINFLIVKYGDESATQNLASEFLEGLASYFKQHFDPFKRKPVHGWIANNPDTAKHILVNHKPDFAFAPPGFYLKFLHGVSKEATPLLQIPRLGKTEERYYLVTSKQGPATLRALQNQTIATVFSIDSDYFRKVVFPAQFQPGQSFQFKPSENLADELFLLIEEAGNGYTGEMGAASALLLDEELKKFFQDDDFVWPELKTIWTSEALPRDLCIAIGSRWTDEHKNQFRQALLDMKNNQPGRDILNTMQSSGFTEINSKLLARTIKRYFSKRGSGRSK